MDEVKNIATSVSKWSSIEKLARHEAEQQFHYDRAYNKRMSELMNEHPVNEVTIDEEDEPKCLGMKSIELLSKVESDPATGETLLHYTTVEVPESFEEYDERINNLEKAMAIQQRLNGMMIRGIGAATMNEAREAC